MKKLNTKGRVLNSASLLYDIICHKTNTNTFNNIIKEININPDSKILDIGCGTGTITIKLGDLIKGNGIIYGLDAGYKMIKKAENKNNNNKVKFIHGISEKLNFKNNYFDIVINTMFLHHIPIDAKYISLKEMYRVLKPGGILITVDLDIPDNIFSKIFSIITYTMLLQNEIKQNVEIGIKKMLEKTGFNNNEVFNSEYGLTKYYKSYKSNNKNLVI